MKKRIYVFLTTFILFITGFFINTLDTTNDIQEVINIDKPKQKLEKLLSLITKETNTIIVNDEVLIIETEPENTQVIEQPPIIIIETEPIVEETKPIIEETEPIIEETEAPILTLDEIALEVISGKWGYGDERRNALAKAGYDVKQVSKRVNEIINGSPYTIPDRNTYYLNFAYVPKSVDVYDENSNREGTISQYQKVLLTNTKINGMTLVKFKNQTFYLKDTDYKIIADSHIEVDISEQKVYMYIDGNLILEADMISGDPNKGTVHGTNLGKTEVYSKSYNVTFDGGKQSKIFILFNWDGEGFHDAGWREDWEYEDKTRYETHGSNGCTNMKLEDVEIIDKYSYLGMPVLIHK